MAEENKPRLYKRGNDDIDLDAYIRAAESEFDFWLAGADLKDNEKNEIRQAYLKLLQGIVDNSVTYKIGGGFSNNLGITNATEDFDAVGLAAGYLGNILRSLNVYTPSEPKPDTSKIKYDSRKSIGNYVLSRLLGEAGNLQYFINLDNFVEGKRGHSNRLALIQSVLDDIDKHWDTLIDSDETEKKKWQLDYETLKKLKISDNSILDENEYLALSRVLGLNNIEDLFYTGLTYGEKPALAKIYNNEEEYLDDKHPRSKTPVNYSLDLKDNRSYSDSEKKFVERKVLSLSDLELLNTIQYILSEPLGKKIGKTVTNQYLLNTALETARIRGILHKFSDFDNRYYIPLTTDFEDNGLVYQISQDGHHKLVLMDQRDIPYFTKKWHDEFLTYVPSNKKGGVLRKFAPGGSTDWKLVAKYRFEDDPDVKDGLLPNRRLAYNTTTKRWEARINKALKSPKTSDPYYITEGDVTELEGLQYFNDWTKELTSNEELAKYWAEKYLENHADNKVKKYWHDKWYDANGKFLFNQFKASRGLNNKPLWNDGEGGIGHDMYAKAVYYDPVEKTYHTDIVDGYIPDGDWDFKGDKFLWVRNIVSKPNNTQSATAQSETNPVTGSKEVTGTKPGEGTKPREKDKQYEANETFWPEKEESIQTTKYSDFVPESISVLRLLTDTYYNRKNYKTIIPSLRPILRESFDRFHPVYGDYGSLKFKLNEGASYLHNAALNYTTDSLVNTASMLEAQKQANRSFAEGFLADNQKISRTMEEALKRVEDNRARNTETANANRVAINKANREQAELEATRNTSIGKSIENYIKEFSDRMFTKNKENTMLSNKFRESIATSSAQRWFNKVMKSYEKAKDNWIKDNTKDGVTPNILDWKDYPKYKRYLELAEDMMKSMIRKEAANIYGLQYNPVYTDAQYKNFPIW